MQERATANALRSALVVIGTLAFGYLNYHLLGKPFLEKAAQAQQYQQQLQQLSEESTSTHQDSDDLILR